MNIPIINHFKKHTCVTILLLHLFACENQPPLKIGLEGKPIPTFKLLLMDSSSTISTDKIATEKPFVLFSFNPHCPYCKAQTIEIIDNAESLSNINFFMLSSSPFKEIKEYYNHFKLTKYKNIIVGQDSANTFGRFYQVSGVPYIAVYNKNKLLKQVYMGRINSSQIKSVAIE
jgi:thiol-disulfide isomerase/thioredoxin